MFDKLSAIEERYEKLMALVSDAAVQADPAEYRTYSKALVDIQPLVETFREYRSALTEIAQVQELADSSEGDMRDLAHQELRTLEARRDTLLTAIKTLLVPKDPNDEKNVVLEIRAGTGGEEAALFAADLFRMYHKFAERQGWRLEVLSANETGVGGLRESIALVEGRQVYSRLKYESGVHRVQRVPETEASGRIHTSTATVAVLPEAEEVDIQIDQKELRIDTFCSSGPGGQSVNTTYSAVRITHLPTAWSSRSRTRSPDQEQGEGDEGAAVPSVRIGAAETAGGDRQGPSKPGRHRRALGEDPNLQLPAEPNHGPPDQLHDAQAWSRSSTAT